MATKTDYLNIRVEPALKAEAERIFTAMGTTSGAAITMFLRQVTLRGGLPFDVCLPNAASRAALAEIAAGGGKVYRGSSADALNAMLDDGE